MSVFWRWLLGIEAARPRSAESWRIAFLAEYGGYVRLAMFVCFAALAYLIIRNYRREGEAPRGAKIKLACVRIIVVVMIFALLFRPAAVVGFTETMYSTIVVLIDDSASMTTKDRYPEAGSDDSAQRLSALLKTDLAGLREMSRHEIERRILLREDGAIAELAEDHNLLIMRFSPPEAGKESYVTRLKTIGATGDGRWSGSPGAGRSAMASALEELRAAGNRTDLAAAVTGALRETVGQRIGAIVVISDGRLTVENAGAALADAKQRAQDRGVPVLTVGLGDVGVRYRNVAVESLRAPSGRVRRGSRVTFDVKLTHTMFAERRVVVRLERRRGTDAEWQQVARSEPVTLEGKDAATTRPAEAAAGPAEKSKEVQQLVKLTVEPKALGRQLGDYVYRATVEAPEGDSYADDNAAETTLRICDDKPNVLLIGVAGWEFQYLRSFFLRERRRNTEGEYEDAFRVSVWQQDADPALNQDASTGMKLERLPRNLEQLIGSPSGRPFPGYEIVMLCDPMATAGGFDRQFAKLLKEYVQDHGGGLCYIAGRKNTETNLLNTRTFSDLAELVPVVLDSKSAAIAERIEMSRPKAFQVYPTPYGLGHPVMKLGAEGAGVGGIWYLLPGIYWSHPVRSVKPLAQVLAVNSSPYRRTGNDEPEPVLVVHSSGAGRALYVGFDSTWRWRYLRDAHYFRSFWRDVVQFLAPMKIRQVSIWSSKQKYDVGEAVLIQAEALDEKYQPVTADSYDILAVNTEDPDAAPRKIELRAVDPVSRPGLYTGSARDLPEGTYEFMPVVPVPQERIEGVRIKVVRLKAETRRPEADFTTLRHSTGLASRKENFLRVYEIDKLPGLISPGRLNLLQSEAHEILYVRRTAALVLALLVALLAVEWFFRKRHNMA